MRIFNHFFNAIKEKFQIKKQILINFVYNLRYESTNK